MIRKLFSPRIPIFHIASMARSGETLLLRCLNQHSRLKVVHNLAENDSPAEEKLFRFLQTWEPSSIPIRHDLLKSHSISRREILILKQGVWEHRYPFNGVLLARNPVASYASMRVFDGLANGKSPDENWHLNEARLIKWMKQIDPELAPSLRSLDPIRQFSTFYNRRLTALLQTGLPVVHYEHLVTRPIQILKIVTDNIGVPFEPTMAASHLGYSTDSIGHGHNRLDQPISDSSLLKYMDILTRPEFDELKSQVCDVASCSSYELTWGSCGLPSVDNYLHSKAA